MHALEIDTVDVKKKQISKHELVTSVGGFNVLMLTTCKYVDL